MSFVLFFLTVIYVAKKHWSIYGKSLMLYGDLFICNVSQPSVFKMRSFLKRVYAQNQAYASLQDIKSVNHRRC